MIQLVSELRYNISISLLYHLSGFEVNLHKIMAMSSFLEKIELRGAIKSLKILIFI